MVGGGIADGFVAMIGGAAYVAPIAFLAIGALMVSRSALVDVRPFRTGLIVTTFGLLAALGSAHGGAIGAGLEDLFGILVGSTGTTIIGALALVVGILLLTGASAGALVRRSGHAVKRAHSRARQALPTQHAEPQPAAPVIPLRAPEPRSTPSTIFRTSSATVSRRRCSSTRSPPRQPRPAEPLRRRDCRRARGVPASGSRRPPPVTTGRRGLERRRRAHGGGARADALSLRRCRRPSSGRFPVRA